ncbi:MAG: sulfotransferase [Desulfobulbaceae bacterium]|nr:sulfotransferase [Desulfobulbaceae bacterium]
MSKKIKRIKKKQTVKISAEIQEKFKTAVSLRQMGLLGQAQKTLSEIIAKAPGHPDSYYLLAEIAVQNNQPDQAISILEKAISRNQQEPRCRGFLADLLAHNGRYAEAIPHFEKELALSHGISKLALGKLLVNTALAYNNSGEPLKSIDKLEMAIKSNHQNLEAYYNLASTFQAIGQMNQASKYAIQSLEIEPLFSKSLYILSLLDINFFSSNITEEIKEKISAPTTSVEDRIYLSFTLYAIFESADNFDEAFKYLSIGNNLKKQTTPYNFNNQALYFRKARELFSNYLSINNLENKALPITPIFIVGMPRSGTTLVEQIIASHTEVTAGGEMIAIDQIARSIMNETFPRSPSDKALPIKVDHLTKYADIYLAEISHLIEENTRFITDKMPQNFFYLGLIKSLFPTARIIHCKRNPVATAFSCYKSLFTAQGQEFANNQDDLAKFYLLYQETIDHWQRLLPESILDVHYERLVSDQENETRKILDFCGLEWDEKCLDFHKTARTVSTASVMQIRKPIYKSSVALWKNYEKNLEPLINSLGEKVI